MKCAEDPLKKYSKELTKLNAGSGVKMTKPILGMVLGRAIDAAMVPESMAALIRQMQDA